MSLLEDVFLENEAGEAQELERIIEGDEFDERPRSQSDSDENSAKEDEAEEDKRRVDPTNAKPKRVIKNPRFVLNPARLTGPRGIHVLPEHFKDFKFKGKGHEREDLDLVLKKLEHWAYRLYPKFAFQDCLRKIETLGKKREVSVHLTKIRMDLITSEETVVQRDSSDDEATPVQEPEDEFDKLLQQQIEIARATPVTKNTPFADRASMMPKATSSPSINDDQRERMLRNRRMAEERRLARLKQNTSQENLTENNLVKSPTRIDNVGKKHNQIDSSDDDAVMNKSVTTDIHDGNKRVRNKSETDDLETNCMVVTKSVKSCVPNKHNRSSIDNAEDNGVMNNNVTIDTHDSNKNDIVELDNEGKIVTKSSKSYVPAKKHNKSRIDSSDDSDALVINEPVTVDVEKHHNDTISTQLKNIVNKNKKTNLIDSSDDDDLVMNEPVTVDVENHHDNVIARKYNKSNIIDSSEDEDEVVVMNESITVDIHDSNNHNTNSSNNPDTNINDSLRTANTVDEIVGNKHDTNSSNNPDTNINDSVFDSLRTANTVDEIVGNKLDTNSSNKSDTNKTDTVFDKMKTASTIDGNVTINEGSNVIEIHDIVELQDIEQNNLNSSNVSNRKHYPAVSNNSDENAIKNDSEKKSDETELSNRKNDENDSQIENVDEIMDVDFGDDF